MNPISNKPEDHQLVLTCICFVNKKGKGFRYQWRVLRYYKNEDKYLCPYMHIRCFPSHWCSLPVIK